LKIFASSSVPPSSALNPAMAASSAARFEPVEDRGVIEADTLTPMELLRAIINW
jgi:hypothetical protein